MIRVVIVDVTVRLGALFFFQIVLVFLKNHIQEMKGRPFMVCFVSVVGDSLLGTELKKEA